MRGRRLYKWEGATNIIAAEIGLELPGENFESSTLANTVGADKTKNLARSWCWQTMELECIRGVTMRNFRLKIGGEINDSDGFEWASEPTMVGTGRHRRMSRELTSSRKYHIQYIETRR